MEHVWIKKRQKIDQTLYGRKEFGLLNEFYISSYACPDCGAAMYKTVFPVGREYPIRTSDGNVKMKRAFTCPDCNSFYTAAMDLLSDGMVYSLTADPVTYKTILFDMDKRGTTQGRLD
jgi:hypothetical protein